MRRAPWVALLLATTALALSLAACEEAARPGPSPGSPTTATAPAGFQTIDAGDQSEIELERPQVFVLDTEGEWEDFWARHSAGAVPPPELPTLEFSSEMAVAVVDGSEPSGGFGIEIVAIEEEGGSLVVRVRKDVPGPDCVVTAVITRPYHIVRTVRSELEPEAQISEEVYSCG